MFDQTALDEELARIDAAAQVLSQRAPAPPRVGVILGSGLGAFADALDDSVYVPYSELPAFPISGVVGHRGRMALGRCGGVPVVVMQGRVHGYEGWSQAEVARGVRVMARMGVEALVVTNAAGGIRADLHPGALMRIDDHVNMSGRSPLTGPNDERLGPRFPDMSEPYHRGLGEALSELAAARGVELSSGVYACMMGPAYETPAEIRMLRAMGADAVGMSTVPEIVAARHMGVPCVGISVITNYAAGLSAQPLSHDEVKETADQVREVFVGLLQAFVPVAAGWLDRAKAQA